jgi:hypothetical protein
MGNSTNKKDAQSNAARDFVNYLVRINEVKSEEVPAVGVSIYDQELDIFVCFPLSTLGFKLTDLQDVSTNTLCAGALYERI